MTDDGCAPRAEAWSDADRAAMAEALAAAAEAAASGEVPVGAVVVAADGRVIGRGYNRRERDGDVTAHAEILALREAAQALGSWRLDGATLYVSLEPCHMCAAACQQARLARLVFATCDPKAGALVSIDRLWTRAPGFHRVTLDWGLEAEAAAEQLRAFFRELRARNRALEAEHGGRGARRRGRHEGTLPPKAEG